MLVDGQLDCCFSSSRGLQLGMIYSLSHFTGNEVFECFV